MNMIKLPKLQKGDKVAVLSPSFAAPGKFPHVYELGLERIRNTFGLEPVEFPTTRKLGASAEERSRDLIAAFEDKEIKAVIASIGGDDQVTYIKNLPNEPFKNNPKPFLGYSDNFYFWNFWDLNGYPSDVGSCLLTQFAMQVEMDEYSVEYIRHALFDEGEFELRPSNEYNDMGLDWNDASLLNTRRTYWKNEGWYWDGNSDVEGRLWGGCVESIDDMLRNGTTIPTVEDFSEVILMLETSEEIPSASYVYRVLRALGERGILKAVKGILIARPKAWEFNKQNTLDQKESYRSEQRETALRAVREYNLEIPVIQNFDFGHTDPQIPMPYGGAVRIVASEKRVFATF